ncbi:relaxase domain-containing protein [Nostoc sp. FACHB-152]|nr:relaxase domain-containing protein [Nostoc sp. FACHB-152]
MALNYFIKNYNHQGKSRWSGQAAEKLGLSGAIEKEQVFKNVIEGRTPDGKEHLNARMVNEKKRRAAIDCTFSAPKSVSLMALVGGDTRLVKAHHRALEKTISLMEERYATTRVIEGDKRHRISTGNLLVAQFDHIESRSLDPHLHTHCLVMNTTQTPDGKWYGLVNSEIYANKKFLGMAYQSYLADEVMKLGYEIEPKLHGQFELKGFKEEDLQVFSKRRQQIIAKCGVNSDWHQREKVWDKTRQRKHLVSHDELLSLWHEEAQKLGITFVKPGEPKLQSNNDTDNKRNINQILKDAIAHCSERNVAFKFEDIAKFILNERLATDVTTIEPLLKQHPQILALSGLEQYTTLKAVEREIATIELIEQGKQKVNPISHPEVIESQLEKTLLNQGQRQAVGMALTTCDQFVAWQGVAGAGKTFALKELKAIAEDAGYTIKAFAPSSMAALVLSEELGISGETVARLLVSEPPPQPQLNQIWIVDEAGLLSAKDAHALLEKATQQGARVLLVGDTKQLSAVEAGNPFRCLQQAGMKTAHLTQSNRQRNPDLKIAVDLIAEGRVEAGFQQLDSIGSIQEISPDEKLLTIAREYMALSPSQREQTLVLAGTNAEKSALTHAIRDKLKTEGSLGATANITQLQAKNLTLVQMRYTHNYEVGEFVMPTRTYSRRGLEKGQLYKVVGKDTDTLTLLAADGKQLQVDTLFDKAVYQCNQIEIAVGERLQWKKNSRTLQRRNGQEFVVTAINGDTASIKYFDNERTEIIDLKQAHNLDYALVSTTYSSQGKTAQKALIAADYTIGQESFYVAVSRAKDNVKIFTEDKQYLLELAQKSKAKENALELLRQQVKQERASSNQEISIVIEEPVASTVASPVVKTKTTVAPPVLKTHVVEQPVVSNVTPPVAKTDSTLFIETPQQQLQQQPTAVTTSKPIPKHSIPQESSVAVEKPIPKKRIPTQAFWTPAIGEPAPNHLDPEHWLELVEKSAIHPDIAALNFESLHFSYVGGEHEAWNRLMISDKLKRTNTGGLTKGFLELYSHIDAGGWWCNSGVDPRSFASLAPGVKLVTKEWGCYKPNQPRPKKDDDGQVIPGKFIKYEHPPKVELSLFLLDVPDEIAQRIYAIHKINPSDSDRACGFWFCVWKHNLPVTITEGAKKAASLLSQGHIAIGLPGISAGYRSPKDEEGRKIGKSYLADELAVFATPKREIKFCFDYETKFQTIVNIKRDISTTGWLLHQQGCSVKVVTLPGPDKGVDDFLVAQGALAYERLSHEARSLRDWQYHDRQQSSTAYQPPRKLTPEEAQHKLATSSPNSPIKEPDHDNHQQPQQSTTRRNSDVNREDRPTSVHNPTIRNTQPTVERENRAVVNEPNRESERVESESHSVLAAIGRYVEQQTIEQLEADLRELNRSLTSGELRGQGRADISANAHQLDSASLDSPTGDVSLEPNSNTRVINAISHFLEITEIAKAIEVEGLETKIRHLLLPGQPHAKAIATQTVQKTTEAITTYLEQEEISSTLLETLPSVIKQLSQYQNVENTSAPEQVQKTVDAIANFIEEEEISIALLSVLPSVTQEITQYQQHLVSQNQVITTLQHSLEEQLVIAEAIKAITDYLDEREIESSALVQNVQQVIGLLNSQPQRLIAPELVQQASSAIASFMEEEEISTALLSVLPSVTQEITQYQQHLVSQNQIITALQQSLEEKLVTIEAIKAITDYLDETEIESSTLVESVQQVIGLLNSQPQRLIAPELVQQASSAIASFMEEEEISTALLEVVPSLTNKITEYQKQLVSQKQIIQAFRDVQSHNPEPDSLSKESQKYREKIELLSYQDFYNLAMYVKSYFEEHSETEDNPKTKALLIIRQIFRDMKAEAMKTSHKSQVASRNEEKPKFKL